MSENRTSQTRRDFLKASTAAVVTGALAGNLALSRGAYAGGSDLLRVGLIGCGGRGTGAARDALSTQGPVKLVAMGDAFADHLATSLANLKNIPEIADKLDVPPERQFVGFDAYKQVIDSELDVVLLGEPPHFRPAHLKYAVEKGKHVFAEKPVAVDAPGVRSVLATCEGAKNNSLSIVSGLCWRYDNGMRETFKQLHDGALGDIAAMQCTYNTVSPKPIVARASDWSDMEHQMRNWYYYTWLSGDFNVEQHVHSLDKMAWAMKDEYPVACSGMGGRQVRTAPEYGNVYDHFGVVYEYANGVRAFSYCRQQEGCAQDVSDHVMGSKGTCDVMQHQMKGRGGETLWRYRGPKNNMYQTEHDDLFASIRSGRPIDNGDYMTKSTLMAIMGRMSAYTGKTITWEQALNSQEDLTPPKYEWGPLVIPSVATPGITPFV